MGESLENKYIYETYKGLIKTEDNLPIDGTLKVLTDGEGNPLPIEVSDTVVRFTGNTVQQNVNIDGYGEVVNQDGEWVGEGGIGTQGPQGPIGPQGNIGSQGFQGIQGPIGTQGFQGAQGINGVDGAQGFQGAQGTNGIDGTQGFQGAQGINGVDGAQGFKGAQGIQGPQGDVGGIAINDTIPGIAHTGDPLETIIDSIYVPANTVKDGDIFSLLVRIGGTKYSSPANTIIRAYLNTANVYGGFVLTNFGITLDNYIVSTTMNRYFYVEDVTGGGIGTGILNSDFSDEFTGTDILVAQLPIDWTVDQYILITGELQDPGNSVFVAGSAFVNAAGAKGEQGPIGPSGGDQGPQGFQGPQGIDGTQGFQGPIGFQGLQGFQGAAGAQGVQGPQGDQGYQGSPGISAGRLFYFNQSQNSDITPYKVLSETPVIDGLQTVSKVLAGDATGVLVQEFLTPELGFTVIPAGIQQFKLYYTLLAAAADVDAYLTLELANSAGIGYGTILTSGLIKILYLDGLPNLTEIDVVFPSSAISVDDRMIVKLYLNNEDATSRTVVWSTEDGYYSYVISSIGVVGNQGPQGPQGFQGAQGIQGPQGFQGTQGPTNPNNIVSTGPNTIASIWEGTLAQYNALGTYDANTIYFIE